MSNENMEWFKQTYPVAHAHATRRSRWTPMTNKKIPRDIPGQRPLAGLPQAIEASTTTKLPKGMPTLSVLTTELARLGFPASDAEDQYDRWLANGFRTNRGQKLQDWKAALRMVIRNNWLPSQRKAAAQENHAQDKESAELARIRRLKREQR